MRRLVISSLLTLLLFTCPIGRAHAAWLQYRIADRQIIGAFVAQADMRLGVGEAAIEWMPGVAPADLVWPTPPSCATGKIQWALLSPGNVLPPILNPTLIFFRCHSVHNLAELRAGLGAEMIRLRRDEVATDLLTDIGYGEMQCNCVTITGGQCDANTGATCNSIRANNDTINAWLGTAADVLALQNNLIALRNEFVAVKNAQGW